MNLDRHGAACRCLLRLRENTGEPGLSDAAFIARFLPRYPDWSERPGATDLSRMLELAHALQLAAGADVFRDYEQVRQAHQAGHAILVYTTFAPEQQQPSLGKRPHVLLLTEADENGFALWQPYASGHSDVLPRAAPDWWDRWLAIGVVLRRSATVR